MSIITKEILNMRDERVEAFGLIVLITMISLIVDCVMYLLTGT